MVFPTRRHQEHKNSLQNDVDDDGVDDNATPPTMATMTGMHPWQFYNDDDNTAGDDPSELKNQQSAR